MVLRWVARLLALGVVVYVSAACVVVDVVCVLVLLSGHVPVQH